jgi:antitoxin CptB
MDLILGRFADREIGTLSESEVAELEHLTNLPDPQVLGWVTGETQVPAAQDTALFRRLRDFHESDEK